MTTFARIDENNIVIDVITAEQDVIASGAVGDPNRWIQTSRNTKEGVHLSIGGTPLRKNYAGIGYTYDAERDAFIPPKRYESWVLNEETCTWQAPVEQPENHVNTNGKFVMYNWNEDTLQWEATEYDLEDDSDI